MLSDNELVSVILPAYNAEHYVEKSIRSILQQTHKNIELLVGIDGSTDRTAQVVKSIDDNRMRVFEWSSNRGNVYTCNELFKRCVGKFIAIQDADDWSHEDRIARQIEFLQEHENIGLVGTGSVRMDVSGNILGNVLHPTDDHVIKEHLLSGKEPCFVCASVMIRKNVYLKVAGYREFFSGIGSADYDWIYRISERFQVANIPELLYFNLRHLASFTKSFSKDPLRKISPRIAYDFYVQRTNKGNDLLDSGDEELLKSYVMELTRAYRMNPSLMYAERAKYLYSVGLYRQAVKYAIIGVYKGPLITSNYMNLIHYIRRMVK